MRTILALVLSCISISSIAETMYFEETEGLAKRTVYQADCFGNGPKGICSLKYISVGNSKSSFKCSIISDKLFENEDALRSGTTWVISTSRGACGYTNTYSLSEAGLVQTKSAPIKKKLAICETFTPKTTTMKFLKHHTDSPVSVEGCTNLNIIAM